MTRADDANPSNTDSSNTNPSNTDLSNTNPTNTISKHRATAAGAAGNVIEWYDFSLYGYMAAVLSQLFFPHEDQLVSLIATYGVFAAGFIMRPLGGFVFGHIGDVVGRKHALVLSVLLMVVPTILLGLLPTYDQWGVWAAVCLVLIRMLQGLSVGGEFSGSATYLAETAPPGRRGFAASWANIGSMIGMLLGAATPAVMLSLLSTSAVNDWGWRIPFLFGGVLGVIALLLRRGLPEPEADAGDTTKRVGEHPIRSLVRDEPVAMTQAVIYAAGYGVLFYIAMVYLPTWLSIYTSIELHEALFIATAAMLLQVVIIPIAGWASDALVKRKILLTGTFVVMAVIVAPLYALAGQGAHWEALTVLLVFAAIVAIPLGVTPALMAETFDRSHRLTGYSLSFNLGFGIAGGTAPMVATWLIHQSGDSLSPAYYLIGCAALAAVTLLTMRDRSREPLR
jgi:MHS family proline/betaine transporter-like MFS transporter